MTNLEKIQNLNAEEMAEILQKAHDCSYISCDDCPFLDRKSKPVSCCNDFKEWLESEVEE